MKRCAFSVLELLVVIAIIGILIVLLLPALVTTRSYPTRIRCQNNLRQIALAATNFHSAHGHFPASTGGIRKDAVGSSDQLSAFVQLLPYVDRGDLIEKISEGCTIEGKTYPPYPALDSKGYEPWEVSDPIFQCPDSAKFDSGYGQTHYGFCIGDRARNISSPQSARGAFAGQQTISFEAIDDGSSNTIMVSEIGARTNDMKKNSWAVNQPASILDNPSQCYELVDSNGQGWQFTNAISLSEISRGGHWADGRAGVGLFNTILPPMSPSAAVGGSKGVDGIYSASGPHKGGVMAARLDGSILFVDAKIDCGDSSSPAPTEEEIAAGVPSPYGVWGALGTINGGEVVDEY